MPPTPRNSFTTRSSPSFSFSFSFSVGPNSSTPQLLNSSSTPTCCNRIVNEGAIPSLVNLMKSCNRSQPHIDLLKHCLNIFIHGAAAENHRNPLMSKVNSSAFNININPDPNTNTNTNSNSNSNATNAIPEAPRKTQRSLPLTQRIFAQVSDGGLGFRPPCRFDAMFRDRDDVVCSALAGILFLSRQLSTMASISEMKPLLPPPSSLFPPQAHEIDPSNPRSEKDDLKTMFDYYRPPEIAASYNRSLQTMRRSRLEVGL